MNTHPQEKTIRTFDFHGANVELVAWERTVWCGKIGYAQNNWDEPDVEAVAQQASTVFPNNTPNGREANWEVCISLNYLSKERPNGVMFGFLVESDQQPAAYDLLKLPPATYMKVRICGETFKALGVQPWTGGIPLYEWIGERIAPQLGYEYGEDTLPVVEYYLHNPQSGQVEACYLYVPVRKV